MSSGSRVTTATSAIRIIRINAIHLSIWMRLAPALDRAKPCAGYAHQAEHLALVLR
jgi:hypothetical protein